MNEQNSVSPEPFASGRYGRYGCGRDLGLQSNRRRHMTAMAAKALQRKGFAMQQ